MARLRLSRLSEKMSLALRAGGSVCGSTVTVLGEPKTWLVRILRRDCWPEFFSDYILTAAGWAWSCNTHGPCLSLLLACKFEGKF